MTAPAPSWTVRSTGATLAVWEYGNPDAEHTVLLVHGYPDDHRMFAPMIDALGDRVRIIAYDTRGGGATTVDDPDSTSSFTLERLAEDTFAVVDSIPGRPAEVHVFGHDWGSVQLWEAMASPRATDVFASYVSVSGPSLDHMRRVTRRFGARPVRWPSALAQIARSWYIWGFQVPGLRSTVPTLIVAAGTDDPAPPPLPANQQRGISLYRANILQRLASGPDPQCAVPTTVVVPMHDRFLSPALAEGLDTWISDLTVLEVNSKHWWPYSHPLDAADVLLDSVHQNAAQ